MSTRDKSVIYKERPVPFEVVGLTAATMIGVVSLFADVVPSSIKDALPVPFQYAWAVTLFLGSLIALVGVVFGGTRGVFFEQIGVFAAGAACLVYSAAVISWRPEVSSIMAFGMVAAYGFACMWRFGQLVRLVHEATAIAAALSKERG